MPVNCDKFQADLTEHILKLGGYWKPLSATARVLEEIGELGDALQQPTPEPQTVLREVADILIITTCLANQYCTRLAEEYAMLLHRNPFSTSDHVDTIWNALATTEYPKDLFLELCSLAAPLARTVNHYEGQKRALTGVRAHIGTLEPIAPVAQQVAKMHRCLVSIANHYSEPLYPVIESIYYQSAEKYKDHFKTSHDPTTEECLIRFTPLKTSTPCWFASTARIWGGRSWNTELSLEQNIDQSLPDLNRLARCGRQERLDAFVIEIRGEARIGSLKVFKPIFRNALTHIAYRHDANRNCMQDPIENEKWRFAYRGTTFFVMAFAPFYGKKHPRYSHDAERAFIVLQPEYAFDHGGLHRANEAERNAKRIQIRDNFKNHGMNYSTELSDHRVEALKYLKPLTSDDPPVRWWEPDQELVL